MDGWKDDDEEALMMVTKDPGPILPCVYSAFDNHSYTVFMGPQNVVPVGGQGKEPVVRL